MYNLTLVIPAKKEKESLYLVLDELKKFNLKIIVIIEESDLETIKSIQNYDCEIIFQKNKGYGDAIIQGINLVKTKFFCIFNADGSFDPKELKKMYELASEKDYTFVFGSRYMRGASSEDDTIITFFGNKVFSLIGKFFFKLDINDILYTYVLGDTIKTQNLNLKEKGFSLCIELPIKIKRSNFRMICTPSNERARIGGKKKVNAFKDGMKILISMITLFFK